HRRRRGRRGLRRRVAVAGRGLVARSVPLGGAPMSGRTVRVNGVDEELAPRTTVTALVAERTASPAGVAVAVNEQIVPRSAWPSTVLAAGDRVEILTAAQGG